MNGPAAAAALLIVVAPLTGTACELVVSDHRAGTERARLALVAAMPQVRVAFVHSVLGTPVVDRYRFVHGSARLVEERFEGEGYGLPHAAGPGESLRREGGAWVLRTDRAVEPLVIRPLPAQRMRLQLDDGREIPLAAYGPGAVRLQALGCTAG